MILLPSLAACSDARQDRLEMMIPKVPSPAPSASGSPAPSTLAIAKGTLIDFDSNAPLANVPIKIAPFVKGAALAQVATSSADGSFAFATSPGDYLLVIGSDSSSDTRATFHNKVSLMPGANAIAQGVPSPQPQVTLSPAQQSGNYRLGTLSAVEKECLTGMNAGRSKLSLSLVVEDQNELEYSRAYNAEEVGQMNDLPSPLFINGYVYGAIGLVGSYSGKNFANCTDYMTYSFTSGNPPFNTVTQTSVSSFAGSFGSGYAFQVEGQDPR